MFCQRKYDQQKNKRKAEWIQGVEHSFTTKTYVVMATRFLWVKHQMWFIL